MAETNELFSYWQQFQWLLFLEIIRCQKSPVSATIDLTPDSQTVRGKLPTFCLVWICETEMSYGYILQRMYMRMVFKMNTFF